MKLTNGGAQHVVTIGVLFTFVGIAYGLWNFDTNTANMIDNINMFLDGMKTAFYTSIIGMLAGLAIKYLQSGVVNSRNDSVQKNFVAVNEINNSTQINAGLLRNILSELQANNQSDLLKNILFELQAHNQSKLLKNILAELQANSNSELRRELRELATVLKPFAPDMKNFSAAMNEQSKMLERLSTTLAHSMETFGEKQIERLDAMRISIEQMQTSIAQAQQNSAELLEKILADTQEELVELKDSAVWTEKIFEELLGATTSFQRESLANDDAQTKILSDNTAQIVAMKNSFDEFLQKMADNFSENFIKILNDTIKDFNNQLKTQFGENFKELNAAVREVVVWQREYKDIVTKTTDELKLINETFNREVLNELQTAMKTFAETSAKNVSVQKNLFAETTQLSEVVTQADESLAQMRIAMENFGRFSDETIKSTSALLKKHLDNISLLAEDFSTEIKNVNAVAFSVAADTKQYLKDFNNASADSMKVIRDTIARYKTDLDTEIKSSLSKLQQLFETVAKNTDAQSGKAIKSLAGALAEVSKQIIGDYKVLVSRIAELDKFLVDRRLAR